MDKFLFKKIQWLLMAGAGSDHSPGPGVVSIKRGPK